MQEWLVELAHNHQYLIYGIIVVLACAEGPILSMIFGALIKLGYFSFFPIYIALMLGDLVGDTFWYYIGRFYGHGFIRRFGKYFSITEEGVDKVTKIFHKYQNSILFISKLTTGFGFAIVTLVTAGIVRIPFGRYISINVIGQFVWTLLLIGVGYFLGHIYTQVDTWLGRLSVGALFVIVIIAFNGYKKYLAQKARNLNI